VSIIKAVGPDGVAIYNESTGGGGSFKFDGKRAKQSIF